MKYIFVLLICVGSYLFGYFSKQEQLEEVKEAIAKAKTIKADLEAKTKGEFKIKAIEFCNRLDAQEESFINCSAQFAECQETNMGLALQPYGPNKADEEKND